VPTIIQDILAGSPLLLRALTASFLAAIACGIVGTYVVLRRESYTVGAVSHSLLGGIGAALLFSQLSDTQWLSPWLGGLLAALLAAIAISLCTTKWKMRTDTVLSAVWALGMALGISFITALPGYPPDLNSYLFGSILIIAPEDLWLMLALDAIVLISAWVFHHRFITLSFNSELLQLRGISPARIQLALQLLIALTVVILAQLVGIILCVALLILPVAAAANCSRRIIPIMLIAMLFCLISTFGGIALSYDALPGGIMLSPGATVVELAGVLYLVTAVIKRLKRK
jgi:zinc transport system permease protein